MSSYPGFSCAFAWFADLALLSLKNKGALVVHRQRNRNTSLYVEALLFTDVKPLSIVVYIQSNFKNKMYSC